MMRIEVLRHLDAEYRICTSCDFWFAADPSWLPLAYTDAITALDTGAVERNLRILRHLHLPIRLLTGASGAVVDWAGGVGLLTRLLRDIGIDAYWQDKYADNVFAKGFEWPTPTRTASVVLAIEAIEHTIDPVAFMSDALRATCSPSIIITQPCYSTIDANWWYLAPETGQHIAFFTHRTLETIARKLEMRVYSAGDLHLFTTVALPSHFFRMSVGFSRVLPVRLFGRRSSIWSDHLAAAERLRSLDIDH